MKIISFAETTEALLAGRKTCTRREWTQHHALLFHRSELVQAYNTSPRAGGHRVGMVQLTGYPVLTRKGDNLPPEDWEGEGFAYMEEHGLTLFHGQTPRQVWEEWSQPGGTAGLWVVRFRLVNGLI